VFEDAWRQRYYLKGCGIGIVYDGFNSNGVINNDVLFNQIMWAEVSTAVGYGLLRLKETKQKAENG